MRLEKIERRNFDNKITGRGRQGACRNAIFVRIKKTPKKVEFSLEKFKGKPPQVSRGIDEKDPRHRARFDYEIRKNYEELGEV